MAARALSDQLPQAMIQDLKNDSARWDQERRKHQSGAGILVLLRGSGFTPCALCLPLG